MTRGLWGYASSGVEIWLRETAWRDENSRACVFDFTDSCALAGFVFLWTAGEAHGLRVELSEGSVTLPLVSKTRRPWAQRTDGYPHIVAMGLGGHAVATSGVTASGSTGRKPSGLRLDARTQAFGLTSLR